MKRVLVTGGNGFLGRYIVENLIKKDYIVTVFVRKKCIELEKLGVKFSFGDIRNIEEIEKALENIDGVFHVAALTGIWGKYEDYYNINYLGTKNIVDCCIKKNIKYFVYTSSPSVVASGKDIINGNEKLEYPKEYNNFYAKTKAMGEKYVIEKSLNNQSFYAVSLRPHLIFGPRDNNLIPRLIQKVKENKLFLIGNGNNFIDVTYVENASFAHVIAYEKMVENSSIKGNCYFITNGEPIKINDFFQRILNEIEIKFKKKSIPFSIAYFLGFLTEKIYEWFKIYKEPIMTRFLAEEFYTNHYFDISKAKKDFNYNPTITIDEGIKKMAFYLKSNILYKNIKQDKSCD